jgi:hypothetical protein
MVRVIEYHFVSSHELFECIVGNNVEVWISNKSTQTLYKFFFILCFPVQIKILHYCRCQMPNVSTIFPTNTGFHFESFQNIISASHQAFENFQNIILASHQAFENFQNIILASHQAFESFQNIISASHQALFL